MKLLEIVPVSDTLPEVVETLADFCERVLGKGIVYAKDTPNFVANRIGIFSLLSVIRNMVDLGLTIETVDELTGPVVGNPKSATFRTSDLVGIDTLVHVASNVYEGAVGDEKRDIFKIPDFINRMVAKKLLGKSLNRDSTSVPKRKGKKSSFPSTTKPWITRPSKRRSSLRWRRPRTSQARREKSRPFTSPKIWPGSSPSEPSLKP
jgi:3-hydroxyacyl-CoA dehydrogenase